MAVNFIAVYMDSDEANKPQKYINGNSTEDFMSADRRTIFIGDYSDE